MPYRFARANRSIPPLVLTLLLLLPGCLYRVNLQKVSSLSLDLKEYQPVAILPISDAQGYPETGEILYGYAQHKLGQKGYTLTPPADISRVLEEFELTAPKLLGDPTARKKVTERLPAKLWLVGTILEYRIEKSAVRSKTFQVWDVWAGMPYEYRALPTYQQGTFEMRLRFRLLEPAKDSSVWMAEGKVRGSSRSVDTLGQRLIERLFENLPSLVTPPFTPP